MSVNTLFLRLEGPFQAWGDNQSKFVIRRTADFPTKSGVIGLLCAALGVDRKTAPGKWIPALSKLKMAVRADHPGVRWWDYHTIGADLNMQMAEALPKSRPGPLLSRREYLCDASFLVALMGMTDTINQLQMALLDPVWAVYLGRKSCIPAKPVFSGVGEYKSLMEAFKAFPFETRDPEDKTRESIWVVRDPESQEELAKWTEKKEIWYDVPVSFEPQFHEPRIVLYESLPVENGVIVSEDSRNFNVPPPPRPRADYTNTEWRKTRLKRLENDHHLCVFCKEPANTVQHIEYPDEPGKEQLDKLASLCRICHDAVTMLEYGAGMGKYRIDPGDPLWRDKILAKRDSIIQHRSIEIRRRRLSEDNS